MLDPRTDHGPEPEPAAHGAPPRRPPTAVGAADGPGDGWNELLARLTVPLMDTDLSPAISRRLERRGLMTIADLVTSNAHIQDLDLDDRERKHLRRWLDHKLGRFG